MSNKLRFPLFLLPLLWAGCTHSDPQINTVCELRSNGTYLIKWETFPALEGTVRAYESMRPDSFNLSTPVFEQDIQSGYRSVLAIPSVRTYFKLVFNRKYTTITADRQIPMQGIFNFRDLGGYYTEENKQIKWGKLYRSGSLSFATHYDRTILKKLQIETIINLQTERECEDNPSKYQSPQLFYMPLRGNRHDFFFDGIVSQRINALDILEYDRNLYSFILENNTDYFIKLFDILSDETNYPVTIFCFLGKERTSIVSALILAALDVDEKNIMDDFLLSNNMIDYHRLVPYADAYNATIQESITTLYSAHRDHLKFVFDKIKTDYGSVNNYLENELNLTPKKREKLKSILLY